ncbi:hypothetical protein M0813_00007 [Anaeramoeba flamelloides]|uniref:B-block binding subunit of TFIIIC domain-containing protein n=1 Tax=Anaeramoeba flamelloides TaxID=1746091 RepID=A0ABQ8YW61_9EUKA|nr:hypothetical protein M0813_00007 [Anaeramoeba flamelloides]
MKTNFPQEINTSKKGINFFHFNCFQLYQQFGHYLQQNYQSNESFRLEYDIPNFLQKFVPDLRSNVERQLQTVIRVMIQNGLIVPKESLGVKQDCFCLSVNWKQELSKIQPNHFSNSKPVYDIFSLQKDQNTRKDVEKRTISMLSLLTIQSLNNGINTREKITQETGYARQRICTVLSIFKGLGIVQEKKKKNRVLKIDQKQNQSLLSIHDLSQKVLELRNKRRKLNAKMKNLVSQLDTKVDKQDITQLRYSKWFNQYTGNYFSRKEKFVTIMKKANSSSNKIILINQKPLPYPHIRSYLGFCSTLNCSQFSEMYESSTIRIPLKKTKEQKNNSKKKNNSEKNIKKVIVIKTRKRLQTKAKKLKIIDKQSLLPSQKLFSQDYDDILHAAHLIISISPSSRKRNERRIQTKAESIKELHSKKNSKPRSSNINTGPNGLRLKNMRRGVQNKIPNCPIIKPVLLKQQRRDSKPMNNQDQLNHTICNDKEDMVNKPQLENIRQKNHTIINEKKNKVSSLQSLDISQLIKQFNSETTFNKQFKY